MIVLLLASLAGLAPALALPVAVGWKTVALFDVFFAAASANALRRGALFGFDQRLVTAAAAFCASACLSLLLHPSPQGIRSVLSLSYSMVVFLLAAHLRVVITDVRRVIQWPLAIAVTAAWIMFLAENTLSISIGPNRSSALPEGFHRLGGLAGGNVLILFLCLGAPLVLRTEAAQVVALLSGYATCSRAMLGVGAGILLAHRPRPLRKLVIPVMAAGAIVAGLLAYTFALVPADPLDRTSLAPSLEPGAYRVLNVVAARMILDAPLLGQGPSTFATRFRDFSSPREQRLVGGSKAPYWDPHSALFGLAAQHGVIGLLTFGWLVLEICRRIRKGADPEHRRLVLAGLTGLLSGGLFVDWLALKGLWLWLGLIVAASRIDPPRTDKAT